MGGHLVDLIVVLSFILLSIVPPILKKINDAAQARKARIEAQSAAEREKVRVLRSGESSAPEPSGPPPGSSEELALRRQKALEELRRRQLARGGSSTARSPQPTRVQSRAPSQAPPTRPAPSPTPIGAPPPTASSPPRQRKLADVVGGVRRSKAPSKRAKQQAAQMNRGAEPTIVREEPAVTRRPIVEESQVAPAAPAHDLGLRFDRRSVRRAIVMAEILQPPIALRKQSDGLDLPF
jgi:type II secretory pathway pseudopilin PulG